MDCPAPKSHTTNMTALAITQRGIDVTSNCKPFRLNADGLNQKWTDSDVKDTQGNVDSDFCRKRTKILTPYTMPVAERVT